MIAPTAALIIGPMAFSMVQPAASSLINVITSGKGKGQEGWFLSFLAASLY